MLDLRKVIVKRMGRLALNVSFGGRPEAIHTTFGGVGSQ
jgi:hypothetical protein